MKKYILLLVSVFSFGQASNQMVTFTEAQSLGFSLKSGQSHVTSNQCMTKSEALTKYNVDADAMSSYAENQLVPRSVWVNADFNGFSYTYNISKGTVESGSANATCLVHDLAFSVYSDSSVISLNMFFYANKELTIRFNGNNTTYYYASGNQLLRIDGYGFLNKINNCN